MLTSPILYANLFSQKGNFKNFTPRKIENLTAA